MDLLDGPPAELDADDDLVGCGLDSVRIMKLAGLLRESGVEVRFAELLKTPTLAGWSALVTSSETAPATAAASVPDVDERAPFPLDSMQQAYWIGRAEGQVLGSGCHFYFEFDGPVVDTERLETAVRALMRRHGMLRARFLEEGLQQIMPESPWPGVTTHDLRDRTETENARALAELRDRLAHRRLDVERGEVFDVQLSLRPDGTTRLHMNVDMLVADALSFRIMLEELAQLYERPDDALPALDYSFPRYLSEKGARRDAARAGSREYWSGQLEAFPRAPELPLAVEPGKLERVRVGRRHRWLPPEDWERLEGRARKHGLTLPMVLATAFAEALAVWSGEPRFVLNLPLFDRERLHPDVPRLVGDFTNLLLLQVDVTGDVPFAERARRVQAQFRADALHAEYSGVEVLRDLARAHPEAPPTAPVVFTSALGMGDLFAPVQHCFGELAWMSSQTAQVWLDFQVLEHREGLLLNWDVAEELFPERVADALFAAYLELLDWLRSRESDWTGPLPSLLPASQAAVRSQVNATSAPVSGRSLHDGFFERARREPDRAALAWGEASRLSYGALADAALRVGGWLRGRGVEPCDPVAVALPKGPDQITAVLGILAAGAAYVPIGVDQPELRRQRIVAGSGARVVIDDLDATREARALPAPLRVPDESPAYVIYTSGSTGEPKGVEVSHRAAVNTIEDINERFEVGGDDWVLAVSALDFDLSVYDVFGLLSAGGALVLVDEDERREPARWLELVQHWGVTIWNTAPALLDMLLVAGEGHIVEDLRLALVSGDWVGLDLFDRLAAQSPGCRLVALGGATEAAIWSNAFEVTEVDPRWRSIPYGRPLRNQRYRVVDERGRDRPDWVAGELWIGGHGVALGYRGDPERTARQFVERDGERWYRTGDRGRYWPDGTLEFLGRVDTRVKIRGHRLELGEIETALESHPAIARAVVSVDGDGAPRLAAFLVPDGEGPTEPELAAFLAERLPRHAVPSSYTALKELPLTANGKVDRREVARLTPRSRAGATNGAPRGPLEEELAEIWSELLGVADVGRDQNFLALGGDSQLATRLVRILQGRMRVELSLRELFEVPTIGELAALIASHRPHAPSGRFEEGTV